MCELNSDVVKVIYCEAKTDDVAATIKTAFCDKREPVVLRGFHIGPCRDRWTPEYLISHCCDKNVKVHKSKEKALDFRKKNFVYETISFRHLILLCSGLRAEDVDEDKYNYYWYLRSIGEDPR